MKPARPLKYGEYNREMGRCACCGEIDSFPRGYKPTLLEGQYVCDRDWGFPRDVLPNMIQPTRLKEIMLT